MLKYTLPLLLSATAFANQYTVSLMGGKITSQPFGIQKEIDGKPVLQEGSIMQISLAEDKGEKFFGLNTRNVISIGQVQSTIFEKNIDFITAGLDKQLYFRWKRLEVVKSLGVGYKFTSDLTTDAKYDNALPSQIYFRVGAELNYFLDNKFSAGIVFTHFSNGGTRMPNIGYDFYGVKLSYLI